MLKKIKTEHLQVGMHLHELCGSWMEHPFWRTKFTLKDADDVRKVRESGITEVWIDVEKGDDLPEAETPEQVEAQIEQVLQQVEAPAPVAKKISFREEAVRAAKICATSKEAVVSMFQEVRMGKAISAEAAGELVDEISSSVLRNPGALISLARLKTADDYTYMHSVAVCALMVALARQLGMDAEQTRLAGMSGLLHDLGKALMPMKVLNKPGKLTDEEFDIMRSHPAAGHAMLLGNEVSAQVLDVCLHHHEKVDGSGYPNRLSSDQISLQAKMGAVCDVYDAITSDRPYKRGWDPAESIRRMAEWKGHFDPAVFQAFVKSVGIYPAGSLVRLHSGRLGVVMEQSDKSLLTPKVKVFFSARSKTPIPQEIIDLGKLAGQDKIVARENPEDWNFPYLDELWSGLPARKGSHFD